MASYGQYCPVAKAVEIVADRWTPLIVRELLAGAHRFNELDRGLPGISRPLLAQRLRRLEHFGVVERRPAADGAAREYHLTPAGRELQPVIEILGRWGARWILEDPKPDELDPVLLLWRMRRRIDRGALPPGRTVVRFEFRGARRARAWLVLEPEGVSVCLTDPGFDTDLLVTADIAALHRVWLGRTAMADAMRQALVEFDGPPRLARAFIGSLRFSPYAGVVRAAIDAGLHPAAGGASASTRPPLTRRATRAGRTTAPAPAPGTS